MSSNWLNLLGAGLGGGIFAKILDYLYKEYIRKSREKKSAKQIIDRHLDPILKASDELVGKIRSLAQSDFKDLNNFSSIQGFKFEEWFPYLDVIYLFSHFWARIQILQLEGLFFNLATDKRGKKLLGFIRALESTKIQIVGRAWQRGMGENLIERNSSQYHALTFVQFVEKFLLHTNFRKWYNPLIDVLKNLQHTRKRQQLLVYGTIIHSMVDTLDTKHDVTGPKPAWPNKLSKKSRRDLAFRVFRVYLPFVKDPQQYVSDRPKKK